MGKNEHAEFPPSGLAKYIQCNGSWHEDRIRPKKDAGPAAARGVLLHEYVVRALTKGKAIVMELKDSVDRYQVLDCVNYLEDLIATFKGMHAVEYEKRVFLEDYGLPQVWGTSDVILYDHVDNILHVVDWKFGSSGIHYAGYNPQGLAYLAGALRLYPKAWKAHFHICQPPLNHKDSFDYDRKEIEDYVEHTIKKTVVGCMSANPEYNPSETACQWCIANVDCKAARQMNLAIAKKLFDEADTPAKIAKITPDELKYILDTSARLKQFLKNVDTYAKDMLRRGENVPGYKLVNGKTKREIYDPKAVEQYFNDHTTHTSADCYEVKFRSPAGFEQFDPGLKNDATFQGMIITTPGSPIMVKEGDKRPAIRPAHEALNVFEKYSDEDYEAQIKADMKGSKTKSIIKKPIRKKPIRKK